MALSILNLFLVLLVAWLAGRLATRFGYPSVLGELFAGIVLGPPLLGWLTGSEALDVLAEVGILLMMLYIGMKIDLGDLKKASFGGLLAALGGFITPFVLCFGVVVWAGGTVLAAIFVGVAAGVTSLATKSRILVDLQLLDTRVAHVMMAGALIADTLSLIIFAAVIGVAESGQFDGQEIALIGVQVLGFFVIATLIGLNVFPILGKWLRASESLGRTGRFTLILLVMLCFAELAELVGMHGILGAFLAGLFLNEPVLGRTEAREMQDVVRDASLGFLAPIFFVTAGFAVSLDVFQTDLGLLLAIVGLATAGKIAGTMLFYLPTGHGWREGLTIGAGMNGRGAVEIIVAQIGLSMGLISQNIFSILVFMAIATTATVPLFLKWGVGWLRSRGELVRADEQRHGVLIVGAGPTARAVARLLQRSQPVWLVDRSAEHCARAEAEGLTVVQGNALNEDVLSTAQAAHVRYALTLTENAEVNALAAQLARTVFLVPDVCVLRKEKGHRDLLDHIGGTTLFAGAVDLAEWDYHLDHDQVEELVVPAGSHESADALVAQLQRARGTLPLAVQRAKAYVPVHSGMRLLPEDRIVVVQVLEMPRSLVFDRFDHLVSRGPVLDIDQALSSDEFFHIAAESLAPRMDISADTLADLFANREAMSSTVILPGLAIPHVVVEGREQFEILVARCRDGVQFPGQAERVHAVFVLVGTADERNFHLRALAAIAKIAQWPDFERNWLLASDAEALRALVLHSVRRRLPERPAAGQADRPAPTPATYR